MNHTTIFKRVIAVLAAFTMAIVPLTASAQYYNQSYYPAYNYSYSYPAYPSSYSPYSAPRYAAYDYAYSYPTYPAYSTPYNYNYSYNYGYQSYAYPAYATNRTASQELRNVTDLDGNVIGDYRRTGTSYNPYYTGNTTTSYNNKGTNIIEIDDGGYVPTTVYIKKGTTIRWVSKDTLSHTVTGDKSSDNINSHTLKRGDTYTKTFSSTGTYRYHDIYNSDNKGKIIVTN